MRKILFLPVLAAVVCGLAASCGKQKPQKTAEELRADSIRIADSIKAAMPADLKNKAIDGLTRYLKKQVSSDPDVGKVIDTKDVLSNDTVYFAKAKVLAANRFGAKEQYDDLWFCVCRKGDKYHLFMWSSTDRLNKGLDHIIGKDACSIGEFVLIPDLDEFSTKMYKAVVSDFDITEMEHVINDF